MHTVVAVISRDSWGHNSCGSVPASSTPRKGEKQGRTKFGKVWKRGQDMGWFRDAERKPRSMKAKDRIGKVWDTQREREKDESTEEELTRVSDGASRGPKRRNLHSQVVEEKNVPPVPPADSPSASSSTSPRGRLSFSAGPKAIQLLCQIPLWAKLSDFQTKNPSGETVLHSVYPPMAARSTLHH